MEIDKVSLLHKEVAATRFSLQNFPWREVKLRSVSRFSQPPKSVVSVINSGGFSYRDSAVVTSTCRNRSILWQYENGSLNFLELSMDFDLASNALRLVFESSSTVFLGAEIQEADSSTLVIMFSTSLTAYRLTLPHPEVIAKDPALSAAGEGLVPSVLAFCKENSFTGANMAAVFGMQEKPVPLSSCASLLSADRGAIFAYPLFSGSIFTIQLPPSDTHVLPVRRELKESSVINKLWNSFLPAVVKGNGEAEDAPISLVLHLFGEDAVILALCRGPQLKVWTVEPGQCVLTHNLSDYLQGDKDSTAKEDQLVIKKAPFGTPSSLRFAVHMRVGPVSQVSIFELLLVESQLLLQPINTYRCPQSSLLVDLQLTNLEVWGVWQCHGVEGREELVVKHALYENEVPTNWREVPLEQPPLDQVLILSHTNPKETYLDSLFYPARFSTASICKTLELYGVRPGELTQTSKEDLIDMVTRQVETELQQSASSDELQHNEYRELSEKCWAKFYRCCLEYHQLLQRPMGLHLDPSTGLALLIKTGVLSFVQPVGSTDYSYCCQLAGGCAVGTEMGTFIQSVLKTVNQLNQDVLDSFLVDLGNHSNTPISMATEIAAVLHEDGSDDLFSSSIPDLSPVLDNLLRTLDPSKFDPDVMEQDQGKEPDIHATMSQLCSSSVSMAMLGSSLQQLCWTRLCLCRDVLIVLCSLKLSGKSQVSPDVVQQYIPEFAQLLYCYHSLHWLLTRPTLAHTAPGVFEANLKLFALLEISPKKASRTGTDCSTTLGELFVSTYGYAEIASALRGSVTTPFHPHWGLLSSTITTTLLRALWPLSSACGVCEFLLANSQYYYIQEFVHQLRVFSCSSWYSLEFLLGQGFLGNGEMDKALACFTEAAAGVGSSAEPYLKSVCGEGSGGGMVSYYIKVVRFFEQFPSPSYVVRIAESATSVVSKDDPESAILWSSLFKHHLELGHSREAYDAMMGNPDPVRKKECLRRLVVVLTEQRRLKELCGFTYSGLEEEVEKVMELRARTVDVTGPSYYDLLYCFHTTRGNHRKAAYVMYEHGLRLGREAPGPKSLHKQANCYCMVLNSLRLTEPQYAWVVRPVEPEEIAVTGKAVSKRKRPQRATKTKVEVLTLADIEKEYLLVRAKLSLVQTEPSLTTQLASPFVSVEEVSALLVQVGLFDKALNIVKRFSLPLAPIFEALASRCVHLSVSFRQSSANTTTWDWLGLNESSVVTTVRENTIADKAWNMLRTNLESHDPSASYVLQKCVVRKLLSMGSQLPQWLMDKYKVTNPAELLKLYLTFDLLEPAASLAIEYIDSVMGHGKEICGIKEALHAHHPGALVWLPYSALDHLQLALKKAPPNTMLQELSMKLNAKLVEYLQLVEQSSSTMEQEGPHRKYTDLAAY